TAVVKEGSPQATRGAPATPGAVRGVVVGRDVGGGSGYALFLPRRAPVLCPTASCGPRHRSRFLPESTPLRTALPCSCDALVPRRRSHRGTANTTTTVSACCVDQFPGGPGPSRTGVSLHADARRDGSRAGGPPRSRDCPALLRPDQTGDLQLWHNG